MPKDVTAVAYTAHMHFRGKSMKTEAFYPDGRHEVILDVPNYDFRWQETYFLKNQFLLPKGTELVTTAHFDNSSEQSAESRSFTRQFAGVNPAMKR